MGKTPEQKADEFVRNAEAGRHEANDELVQDQDPRDAYIVRPN